MEAPYVPADLESVGVIEVGVDAVGVTGQYVVYRLTVSVVIEP